MFGRETLFAVDTVAEVCGLARQVQDRIASSGEALTKTDHSPVTVADLAIQAVVSLRLRDRFPADGLLAEEDASTLENDPTTAARVLELCRRADPDLALEAAAAALDRGGHAGGGEGRYWVLDPIDGTKGFLRGDQYAVALALVERGRVVVGVLGCPNLPAEPALPEGPRGCIFAAERGRGAALRRLDREDLHPISVDPIHDSAEAVVCESVEAAHAAHSDQATIALELGITASPVRIDSQCKYGVVARGEASIYLRLPRRRDYREKVWDHAAGSLVIEEAGGRVSDLEGRPLDFSEGRLLGRHHGIVATNGHLHDKVLAACRSVLGL